MKIQELIDIADEQDIIINITDIFAWLDKYASNEVNKTYLDTRELPDDISIEEVEKAGNQLIAF